MRKNVPFLIVFFTAIILINKIDASQSEQFNYSLDFNVEEYISQNHSYKNPSDVFVATVLHKIYKKNQSLPNEKEKFSISIKKAVHEFYSVLFNNLSPIAWSMLGKNNIKLLSSIWAFMLLKTYDAKKITDSEFHQLFKFPKTDDKKIYGQRFLNQCITCKEDESEFSKIFIMQLYHPEKSESLEKMLLEHLNKCESHFSLFPHKTLLDLRKNKREQEKSEEIDLKEYKKFKEIEDKKEDALSFLFRPVF